MSFRYLFACLVLLSSMLEALTCSVIIPCHHTHFQYLPKLLKYIERSTRHPDEVIISLSGCREISPAHIEEIKNQPHSFPVHFILHDGSVSRGGNRNYAAADAKMDVLICQDADDVPHPDRIAICMRAMETNEALDLVLHGCAVPHEAQVSRYVYRVSLPAFLLTQQDKPILPIIYYPTEPLPQKHHCFCNGVPILKRSIWTQGYHWIENLQRTEDVKFVRVIMKRAPKRACFINLPLYYYRMQLSAGYEGKSIWMPADNEYEDLES